MKVKDEEYIDKRKMGLEKMALIFGEKDIGNMFITTVILPGGGIK